MGRFYSWSEFDSIVPFILTTDIAELSTFTEVSQIWKALPLHKGWTVGTGQEYAEVGANPEVPAPF